MAQITKRGATQSIFDKTALQELLPFDRITEMQCWCYVPLRALTGAPGGIGLRTSEYSGKFTCFFFLIFLFHFIFQKSFHKIKQKIVMMDT